MRLAAVALAVVAVALAPASAAPRRAVDWTRTVTIQPSGGYAIGNPKAKVKLVEYVSLTCSHCSHFDEEGAGPLIAKYVKTGKVRYEMRNFVRDPYDMSASLIARCNGSRSVFPLTRALLKDQAKWTATVQRAPKERLEALSKLPINRIAVEAASIAGLPKWAAAHGVPLARSRQCLANATQVERLIKMTSAAAVDHPDFVGTPSFIVNGEYLGRVASWGDLEPKLRAALGERG